MPLQAPRRTRIPRAERAAWRQRDRDRAPLRLTVGGPAPAKAAEPDHTKWVPRQRGDEVPLRLHVNRMAPGPLDPAEAAYYGGSLEWSPEFARWLSNVVVVALIEDHLPYSRWHESPYVVSRLKNVLGDAVVDAVLAYQRASIEVRNAAEHADWDEMEWRRQYHEWAAAALAPFHCAVGWAERMQRRIWTLARGDYQMVNITMRQRSYTRGVAAASA